MYAATRSPSDEVRELAAKLYREKRPYLLSIARHNAIGDADAEEALQEAFASFIRRFDPDAGAPPMAWLTLTLKRQCWRQRREAHLDRQLGQEAERGGEELGSVLESIPSAAFELEQRVAERDDARRRIGRLKPDQRIALGFFAAGFSYREIAGRRGWTYTKVNRCVSEGRAALRRGQRAK
ncbi:MAG TPA: sigma-70 family RNA polymerase sigma factor [Solirubrobacterales bacterium]|nr:sigma-70 family RNA polymerase sigma factor [Solirubrobacterales bacterium]